MRRHGWAFCLGVLFTGTAAAQPPAADERFPPAPDLPGQVVSQSPTLPKDPPAADQPATPPGSPAPDATVVPNGSTPTTPVIPVEPAPVAGMPGALGMFPAAAPWAVTHCRSGWGLDLGFGCGELKEWFCFRSRARQTGHHVPSYRPPLVAWFPCEPRPAAPFPGVVAGPVCTSCAQGVPAPAMVAPVVPGTGLPEPAPVVPVTPEPPLTGGVPVGSCPDIDVLTAFQPLGPGLGFTPGLAPMANPTTLVKPAKFKPK